MALYSQFLRSSVAIAISLLLLASTLPALAQSATLSVNGTTGTVKTGDACPTPRTSAVYRTIQAAINCAQQGDTLQITAGSYTETISLAKSLTLQGADDITTIVNGGGSGRVLTVDGAVSVAIDGLTFTNGSAPDGAGILTRASTLTIANSTISSNVAAQKGGGLLTQAGSVTLTNTQITGNSAPDGGGIFTQGGTVTLHGTTISGNTATGAGGGIYSIAGSLNGEAAISNNTAATDADIHTVVAAISINPLLQGNISASISLQGRPAAPDPRWSIPLHVTLTAQGSPTPAYDSDVTTNQLGVFALQGFTPGTYLVRVKGLHTLSNVRTVVLNAGPNTLDLGTLREGDTDNNDIVNLTDFSLLAATFGKQSGNAGYDGRADFNGDGVVNLTDFSLLATNFGKSGDAFGGSEVPIAPTETGPGTLVPLPTAPALTPRAPAGEGSESTPVPLALQPEPPTQDGSGSLLPPDAATEAPSDNAAGAA
jgi:hypothetical protein